MKNQQPPAYSRLFSIFWKYLAYFDKRFGIFGPSGLVNLATDAKKGWWFDSQLRHTSSRRQQLACYSFERSTPLENFFIFSKK